MGMHTNIHMGMHTHTPCTRTHSYQTALTAWLLDAGVQLPCGATLLYKIFPATTASGIKIKKKNPEIIQNRIKTRLNINDDNGAAPSLELLPLREFFLISPNKS